MELLLGPLSKQPTNRQYAIRSSLHGWVDEPRGRGAGSVRRGIIHPVNVDPF